MSMTENEKMPVLATETARHGNNSPVSMQSIGETADVVFEAIFAANMIVSYDALTIPAFNRPALVDAAGTYTLIAKDWAKRVKKQFAAFTVNAFTRAMADLAAKLGKDWVNTKPADRVFDLATVQQGLGGFIQRYVPKSSALLLEAGDVEKARQEEEQKKYMQYWSQPHDDLWEQERGRYRLCFGERYEQFIMPLPMLTERLRFIGALASLLDPGAQAQCREAARRRWRDYYVSMNPTAMGRFQRNEAAGMTPDEADVATVLHSAPPPHTKEAADLALRDAKLFTRRDFWVREIIRAYELEKG